VSKQTSPPFELGYRDETRLDPVDSQEGWGVNIKICTLKLPSLPHKPLLVEFAEFGDCDDPGQLLVDLPAKQATPLKKTSRHYIFHFKEQKSVVRI
jgi:hypothetical protein